MSDFRALTVRLSTYDQVRAGLNSPALARADEGDKATFIHGNMLENTINQLHGDAHRTRRQASSALFSKSRRWDLERKEVTAACHRALSRVANVESLNLIEFTRTISIVNAIRVVGIDVDLEDTQAQVDLCRLARIFASGAVIEDQLRPHEEIQREVNEALDYYDRTYFSPSFRARMARREADPAAPGEDLLDVLGAVKDGVGMRYEDILRESAFYLAAGSDTTTQSTAALMHYVFEHAPDVTSLATDLPLLQLWLHEALRIRTVVPTVHRRALWDADIADVAISKGTKVDLDLHAASMDPQYYGADAADFNPGRLLADGVPRFGFAFSAGMHACLGRGLAGGAPVAPGRSAGPEHLVGVVTMIAGILLEAGFSPDPDRAPSADPNSSRWSRWLDYPVRHPVTCRPVPARTEP